MPSFLSSPFSIRSSKSVSSFLSFLSRVSISQSRPSQSPPFLLKFSIREPGGAGYIGSHATLQLLKDSYRVAIVDNLSRKNLATVKVLQNLFPEPGRLQFIYADLGDAKSLSL
ncbi:hypothetical protein RIF29_08665 [Crotalaria pallida]|uniref:NAD(P)-binding domain-containing protein n=1 Tax=Crotalaria pallida TaxID=3830 RepID=A0AAN9FR41_CROPI